MVLKLTSKDVTHALYIPAFRVQRNAVPGQNTEIWFEPTVVTEKDPTTGEEDFYHVFCTQYCGNGHAEMNTKAFVLNKEDYDKKLAEAANIFVDKNTKQPLPYAEVGKKLYTTMGCAQCHSINGAEGQGPTWKGLYKSNVEFSKSNDARLHAQGKRRRQEVGRLSPRVDPPSRGQDRAGIPEHHAFPGIQLQRIAV